MLDLKDITLKVGDEGETTLLEGISLRLPHRGQLVAILGPSGCGKSTLLRVIAGLQSGSSGSTSWRGRILGEEGDFDADEIGYVPQFSIAHEKLFVWECVEDAVRLRCAGLEEEAVAERVDRVLEEVGMMEIAEKRVEMLSGGQRRRLALGLEIVSSPGLLLCDEVTSGLDPRSEREVTELLKRGAEAGRVVLNVTHSLAHLDLHDYVIVLSRGRLLYHGPPKHILHYFGITHREELYPRLSERQPEEWARSWEKHGGAYYKEMEETNQAAFKGGDSSAKESVPFFQQLSVLLRRRWRLFWRDTAQLKLQAALILGFPCLVVIFALQGLPALRAAAELPEDPLRQLVSDFSTKLEYLRVGGMVSGLIMFQVVLLTLMGSNNSAREIAGERLIFEKEKFAGVSHLAYVFSKLAFLLTLAVVQSVWMSLFVHFIVQMPGNLLLQTALLFLVNAAMTSVSLGISAMSRTAEQSSLISVYLVGFQLPLSGAVLALPDWLGGITRPFIASYWGWAGFLQTLQDTRFYNAVVQMTQTPLMPLLGVIWVLLCHIGVGVFFACSGARASRWE